jgi:hypothetical protein
MQTEHICDYYAAITEVYLGVAAELEYPVAHIAEFYLERWWAVFSEGHRVELNGN